MQVDVGDFFKAKALMTEENVIEIFDYQDNEVIKKSMNHMRDNRYDLAIIKNKKTYGYILQEEALNENNIQNIFHEIKSGEKITPNDTISTVLDRFYQVEYQFVFYNDEFCGLITYADFNRLTMTSFLYVAISFFEKKMRQLVNILYPGDSWLKKFNSDGLCDIGGRYLRDKVKGIDRTLLESTTFSQIANVLAKKSVWREYLRLSRDDYESLNSKIIDLRNNIMHSKNIISERADLKTLCNTIKKFNDVLEKILSYLANYHVRA